MNSDFIRRQTETEFSRDLQRNFRFPIITCGLQNSVGRLIGYNEENGTYGSIEFLRARTQAAAMERDYRYRNTKPNPLVSRRHRGLIDKGDTVINIPIADYCGIRCVYTGVLSYMLRGDLLKASNPENVFVSKDHAGIPEQYPFIEYEDDDSIHETGVVYR